ncbi:hypothetical protein DY000_02034120 [Brassica cretica]|uniref:Uncharacterized protein n=1 Tax=Brassica cretica TaxID=69181 RepID=A0ABQ7DYZ7_BRACR|nr:hypothetical protein DY000_02034120 [Brassica cretica]
MPPVLQRYTDVTEKLTRLDPVMLSATKDPLYASTGPGIWKVTGARKYLNEHNRTLIETTFSSPINCDEYSYVITKFNVYVNA